MTKIITRYFDDAATALKVKRELVLRQGLSARIVGLYDEPKGLGTKLGAANVAADTAQAYEKKMASGGAVLLVQAGYKPLGVARIARETMDQMGASRLQGIGEENYVKDIPNPKINLLRDHPLFLTRARDPDTDTYHMANWPIPLISRAKPFNDMVFPPHSRMASFPIPLISKRKPFTGSIIGRHARMANFPLPLISKRKPFTGSIIARHGRMANFPIPLISKRKPFTGTLIGRHTRMANWPFPHLINGKTGTNSLVPGGARMANFPISLISKRKPFTGSIIPRHGRMARFPIPLISHRKPYTGSMIDRHGRMADKLLPLVIKSSAHKPEKDSKGFSFSKLLGIPTLIAR